MSANSPESSDFYERPEAVVSPGDIFEIQSVTRNLITNASAGQTYDGWKVTEHNDNGVVFRYGTESYYQYVYLTDCYDKGIFVRSVTAKSGQDDETSFISAMFLVRSTSDGPKFLRVEETTGFEKLREVKQTVLASSTEYLVEKVATEGTQLNKKDAEVLEDCLGNFANEIYKKRNTKPRKFGRFLGFHNA